ncbi:MAG: carbohydrate kinase [Oscillochloris sp.]|nr:carbohydrate kinase [Oscillochloris sp.]
MAERLILGIDQGGSGSRAVLYDHHGHIRGYGYRTLRRQHPQPGWVEQRPGAVARSVRESLDDALARAECRPEEIVACGITSQRDTVFAWDAQTGAAIGNAITWQDLRTLDLVHEVNSWPLAAQRRARLGQFPGSYSGAMHMAWRMRHDEPFRRAAQRGRLRVSLAAGWVLRALGEPAEHALDYSLLQGMSVFDPRRRALWDEWITALDLPPAALPAPRPTIHHFGDLHLGTAQVPVLALIADQQAALFGYDCRSRGMAAGTHGTASFINIVAGSQAPAQGVCKTYLAWEIAGVPTYSLEADMTVTGAAVRWLQQIGIIRRPQDLDVLAGQVPHSDGVVFVPAFTGLGVPSEDRSARGSLFGMTLGTSAGHIARAFLESIGCQLHDILDTVEREADLSIHELRVGGGLANSDLACQIQADLAGVPVVRARDTETTARAAALLAGIGAGIWPDTQVLPSLLDGHERVFEPRLNAEERAEILGRWHVAINRVTG